jgi:hypothetical protein
LKKPILLDYAVKVAVTVLTNDYVAKDNPELHLIENDRVNEMKNPLSDITISKTVSSAINGEPISCETQTAMQGVLCQRYKPSTELQTKIEELTTNKDDGCP